MEIDGFKEKLFELYNQIPDVLNDIRKLEALRSSNEILEAHLKERDHKIDVLEEEVSSLIDGKLKKRRKSCDGCDYLSSDSNDDNSWPCCSFWLIHDEYDWDYGEALDRDLSTPLWCPLQFYCGDE